MNKRQRKKLYKKFISSFFIDYKEPFFRKLTSKEKLSLDQWGEKPFILGWDFGKEESINCNYICTDEGLVWDPK